MNTDADTRVCAGKLRVHILTAEGLRDGTNGPPRAWMRLRLLSTRPVPLSKMDSNVAEALHDDSVGLKIWQWNQSFMIDVQNGNKSQLEITLWDAEQPFGTTAAFLGEVILNIAKLLPYANQHVEQDFNIKQGRHYTSTDMMSASGILSLHLIFIPEETGENGNEPEASLDSVIESLDGASNLPLPSSSASPIVASSTAPLSHVMEAQIGATQAHSSLESQASPGEEIYGPIEEECKDLPDHPAKTASILIEKLSELALEADRADEKRDNEPSNLAFKSAPSDRRPPALAPSMSVRALEQRHLVSHSPLSSSHNSLVTGDVDAHIPDAHIAAPLCPPLLQSPTLPTEIASTVIPQVILRKIVSSEQSAVPQDALIQACVPTLIDCRLSPLSHVGTAHAADAKPGRARSGVEMSRVQADARMASNSNQADMDVDSGTPMEIVSLSSGQKRKTHSKARAARKPRSSRSSAGEAEPRTVGVGPQSKQSRDKQLMETQPTGPVGQEAAEAAAPIPSLPTEPTGRRSLGPVTPQSQAVRVVDVGVDHRAADDGQLEDKAGGKLARCKASQHKGAGGKAEFAAFVRELLEPRGLEPSCSADDAALRWKLRTLYGLD